MIPGLENAQFARLGGIHRNTFINSPVLLDKQLKLTREPRLRFAGQVTGVEGYVESAAMGLLAGRMAAHERLGRLCPPPPITTALGALVNHITGGHLSMPGSSGVFQPMNINYGLFPGIETFDTTSPDGKRLKGADKTRSKKRAMSGRALADIERWLSAQGMPVAVA
jgi:methylenetetrahydrofolate--tRNA-(uracil-5-)-methyltransferase